MDPHPSHHSAGYFHQSPKSALTMAERNQRIDGVIDEVVQQVIRMPLDDMEQRGKLRLKDFGGYQQANYAHLFVFLWVIPSLRIFDISASIDRSR